MRLKAAHGGVDLTVRIINGDCREVLPGLAAESVHCVVTSPPYFGLRDYGVEGQIGLEPSPIEYVDCLVEVFREVRRVLRADGTLWLNLGDSYANDTKWGGRTSGKHVKELHGSPAMGRVRRSTGLKAKDLIGIPWRVAFALQEDGWYLRQDIIWSKPNPMPESVRDRCTKAHEYIFLLSKRERYWYDASAIQEPFAYSGDVRMKTAYAVHTGKSVGTEYKSPVNQGGRNRRSVWEVATQPFGGAHFATFPPVLIEPCILAGCPQGGVVLDPFGGAGTVALVADRRQRNAIVVELNPTYAEMAENRIRNEAPMLTNVHLEAWKKEGGGNVTASKG